MQVKIGKGTLKVFRGDITEQETEAIVNAANNHLWMGAGVAGAIKRKGGAEIEHEAVSQGPIEVGGAVLTGAGKLKAKYVIHAAGMGQDLHTDGEKIKKSTFDSLKLAEEKKIQSISFPAIGTGVGGFSARHCARIMIGESVNLLQKATYLKEVAFVLFDETTLKAFQDELQNLFSARKS
ncbi:MAG: macro domain-containing protein [Bacteroidota bacterium]